ncbi:MAG: SGNH/GDSL hydrolase family protein [Paludibacter sp.]|nr:SGNH/GDSL hydrolase family protein [Paludibacter sp.]
MSKKIWFNFTLLAFLTISSGQAKTINFNNPNIRYEGRILYNSNAAVLSWSGTSVTVNFQGKEISAILQDMDTANYYNVILDKKVVSKIHTDTTKHSYILASGLFKGNHTLQLFKRTEWDKGKTLFYGFETSGNTRLLPPSAPKKRKIEFYGNSITCGYAMEDTSGKDSWYGYFENNYLSYAALTARHYDAQYQCISKSGIGVMVSWFPLIMPEMYDRTDATDSISKWNFSNYTPDIVVINLFQNDSWIIKMHDNAEFKHRFGTKEPNSDYIIAAYKSFVTAIRSKYPKASIICALGNMDATREGSVWPGYIEQAAKQLNDPKIYTCFFKYKNTDGHPKVPEQQAMADSLIKFIDKNINW